MDCGCQAPLSLGFSRQEYWSGYSPGDLPDLGIEPSSPALAGGFFTTEPPGKLLHLYMLCSARRVMKPYMLLLNLNCLDSCEDGKEIPCLEHFHFVVCIAYCAAGLNSLCKDVMQLFL